MGERQSVGFSNRSFYPREMNPQDIPDMELDKLWSWSGYGSEKRNH
jgi:hypothetical protein